MRIVNLCKKKFRQVKKPLNRYGVRPTKTWKKLLLGLTKEPHGFAATKLSCFVTDTNFRLNCILYLGIDIFSDIAIEKQPCSRPDKIEILASFAMINF